MVSHSSLLHHHPYRLLIFPCFCFLFPVLVLLFSLISPSSYSSHSFPPVFSFFCCRVFHFRSLLSSVPSHCSSSSCFLLTHHHHHHYSSHSHLFSVSILLCSCYSSSLYFPFLLFLFLTHYHHHHHHWKHNVFSSYFPLQLLFLTPVSPLPLLIHPVLHLQAHHHHFHHHHHNHHQKQAINSSCGLFTLNPYAAKVVRPLIGKTRCLGCIKAPSFLDGSSAYDNFTGDWYFDRVQAGRGGRDRVWWTGVVIVAEDNVWQSVGH